MIRYTNIFKIILFAVILITQLFFIDQLLLAQDNSDSFEKLLKLEMSIDDSNVKLNALEVELNKFESNFKVDIAELKSKVDSTIFKFDAIKETYNLIITIFAIVTIVGSILSVYSIIDRRIRERKQSEFFSQNYDQRLKSISEETQEVIKKYESFIVTQEGKRDELIKNISSNIRQTTDLFKALESTFRFQEEAKKIKEQLLLLQEKDKDKDDIRSNLISETNKEAMAICLSFNRSTYAAYDNQQKFHEFYLKSSPRIQEYELDYHKDDLNANCYLIYGLNFQIRNISNPLEYLQKAIIKSKRYSIENADEKLYPGLSQDELKKWNRKLANISLYHAAIIKYNFGEYKNAIEMFKDALVFDKNDIKSMIYIPEAKFLGYLEENFESIVNEFEKVKQTIEETKDISSWSESKDNLLSQLFVRFGNCYFAKSNFEPYQKYRSLNKSLEKYEFAYNKNPKSYLAKFSYAQVLSAKANQKTSLNSQKQIDLSKSKELFNEVFTTVRNKISSTSETKILMMLYYIIAICCVEGQITNENPKIYLIQIYRESANLQSKDKIKIFSPKTKNDLNSEEFLNEVQEFERTFKIVT